MRSMTDTTSTATTKLGQPLQALPFTSRPLIMPQFDAEGNFTGKPYKIELVLLRGLQGGARQHLWLAPDPRPHNHPWEWISCQVVRGSYTAIEYTPSNSGGPADVYRSSQVTLTPRSGAHTLAHHVHHQVVSVEPGTVSIMTFGPIVGDGKQWGHLKLGGSLADSRFLTGTIDMNTTNPAFLDALRHMNPHIRPLLWHDPYAEFPVPSVEELVVSVA